MLISFFPKNKKEYFNGKEYQIGTVFTKIYNELSSLTFNKSFYIDTYKNEELYKYYCKVLEQLQIDNILQLFQLPKNKNNISEHEPIEIEGINVSYEEFKNLVKFCVRLDEYIRLVDLDKRFMKKEKILFFFSVMCEYNIPTFSIQDEQLIKTYNKKFFQDRKNKYNIDETYRDILESDKDILRAIRTSNNTLYNYNCDDFIQILLVSYISIIENNFSLKQCPLCNRFFIGEYGNEKFCNNLRPQFECESNTDYSYYLSKKETCREYNKRKYVFDNSDTVKKAKRTVTLRIQKRIREGIETVDYLEKWKEKVNKHMIIDKERYIDWILNHSDNHSGRSNNNVGKRTNKK